jgi:hypothetical protein
VMAATRAASRPSAAMATVNPARTSPVSARAWFPTQA